MKQSGGILHNNVKIPPLCGFKDGPQREAIVSLLRYERRTPHSRRGVNPVLHARFYCLGGAAAVRSSCCLDTTSVCAMLVKGAHLQNVLPIIVERGKKYHLKMHILNCVNII